MEPKNNKGRPRKKKIVQEQPKFDHFGPTGSRADESEEVILTVDEFETIRLADHKKLSQKEAAAMMGISQQSFSRIMLSAREKIADAIVNVKFIRIGGGDFINKRSLGVMERLKRRPKE